jgi:hypothetical protein
MEGGDILNFSFRFMTVLNGRKNIKRRLDDAKFCNYGKM